MFEIWGSHSSAAKYLRLLAYDAVLLGEKFLTNLTFRGPCIVIYTYNKSQQDAPFRNFILVKNYMFQTYLLSIIRSLNTVFTAIGICHTSYVDSLLARSILTSLADSQQN